MKIAAIKTPKITNQSHTLNGLLDDVLSDFKDGSILAVSSKIVSLCEGRVVPLDSIDKEELIAKESDYFLPPEHSQFGHHFTIVRNTLVGSAGIDISNGNGNYILWPKNPQKTANEVRGYLINRCAIKNVGVVIVDSISTPLRLGAIGTAIAFSGFEGTHSYVGSRDLFGYQMKVEKADIAGGIAAAATLAMGEGAEQTPLAVISDTPFVKFVNHVPNEKDLQTLHLGFEDDLFAPFLKNAPWQEGYRTNNQQ
jgi:F420-0:gamma-glutamyl ligase